MSPAFRNELHHLRIQLSGSLRRIGCGLYSGPPCRSARERTKELSAQSNKRFATGLPQLPCRYSPARAGPIDRRGQDHAEATPAESTLSLTIRRCRPFPIDARHWTTSSHELRQTLSGNVLDVRLFGSESRGDATAQWKPTCFSPARPFHYGNGERERPGGSAFGGTRPTSCGRRWPGEPTTPADGQTPRGGNPRSRPRRRQTEKRTAGAGNPRGVTKWGPFRRRAAGGALFRPAERVSGARGLAGAGP